MSKVTAYTLSLIQKAKEVARNNKILKRQRDKEQLNEALEYVYKHLDEWYSKHIDDTKTPYEVLKCHNVKQKHLFL